MSASVVTRSSWTDDSGSGVDGTIVKNSELAKVYDNIDLMFSGTGSYTTLTFGGKIRVEGAGMEIKGAAAPSLSAASESKLYFDSTQNRLLRSENGEAFRPFGTHPYAATVADVANTTTRTATLSFTVPANEMRDGDVIIIECAILAKQNSGGAGNVLLEWFWGATGVALSAATAWTNNATEIKALLPFKLQRVGNDLWIRGQESTARPDLQTPTLDLTPGNTNVVSMTPNFASSASVELRVTLNAANAGFYWKTQKARVLRYQAA